MSLVEIYPIRASLVKSVKSGESAIFTCNATYVPGHNITWKRENGQNETLTIVDDGKYEITSSGNVSQLTIKDASSGDHGYYMCDTSAIGNQPSPGSGFLGLISLTKSNILCPNSNQKAHKGVATTICCPVHGFPPPKVTWKLPDGTVRKTENTILPITPQEKDFGTYTCIADGLKQTVPDPIIVSIKLQKEEEKIQSAATTQGLSFLLGIALFMPFIKLK